VLLRSKAFHFAACQIFDSGRNGERRGSFSAHIKHHRGAIWPADDGCENAHGLLEFRPNIAIPPIHRSIRAGLHFINPFSQVVEMEVRTRNYTMSNVTDEGQKKGDDSIQVITSDGLTVKLDCTIFYSLQQNMVAKIYRDIGPDVEDKILRSEIRASLRDAAANLTATDLYTLKRQSFVDNVTRTLKASFESRGITMEQVLLRNVILPDQITKAINDKIAADQDAQKMIFVLQKEKQEAERKRIEAEGQATAQKIVSQSLTPQILEYQRIQALRYVGEKGNLIITNGGATPMIQIPAKK